MLQRGGPCRKMGTPRPQRRNVAEGAAAAVEAAEAAPMWRPRAQVSNINWGLAVIPMQVPEEEAMEKAAAPKRKTKASMPPADPSNEKTNASMPAGAVSKEKTDASMPAAAVSKEKTDASMPAAAPSNAKTNASMPASNRAPSKAAIKRNQLSSEDLQAEFSKVEF